MDTAVRHIPSKIVKRRNTPLWFDSESSHLYKRKKTARRKAKRTSKPNDLEHFQNLCRSQHASVRSSSTSLPDLMKSNVKKLWSVFKSLSRTANVPRKMVWSRGDHSVTTEEPDDIANLLNEYFYSTF